VPALGALLDGDGATEGAHVVAHQRQTETSAARHAAVVGRSAPKESLEDLFTFLRRNARPASSMSITSVAFLTLMRMATTPPAY